MADRYKILAVDDNSISLATIEQALKGKYEFTPLKSDCNRASALCSI